MISTTNERELSSPYQMKYILRFLLRPSEGDLRKRELNFLIPFREEKTPIKAFIDGFCTPAFGKIDVLHHGGMALLEFCSKLLFTYLGKKACI